MSAMVNGNGPKGSTVKEKTISVPVQVITGPFDRAIETRIVISGVLLDSLLRRRAWITSDGLAVTIHLSDTHDQPGSGTTLVDVLAKLALS